MWPKEGADEEDQAKLALQSEETRKMLIDNAKAIAGRLPFVKRKQANFRLYRAIDRLEQLLFEASFPSSLRDGLDE